MTNNRITPFVKRMRSNGGTIYTFSSAIEDIGLNINERNNLVKISHFALLNIPNISEPSVGFLNNTFNVRNIIGAWEWERNSTSIKDGRVIIAESFENYALNLESNLLNQSTYNPELTATVSERVFWKWLKETGSIRWDDPSTAGNGIRYWQEELDSNNYTSVVKYVGQVSAGNVRIDNFGTYNETYVLIPTSHGQTRAYFKQVEDDNYRHGMIIGDLGENILGREGYTKPHPDGLSYKAYYDFVDSSTQLTGGNEYDLFYDPSAGSFSSGWWYSPFLNPAQSVNDNAYITDSSLYLSTEIYNTDLRYVPSGAGNTINFRRSSVDCITLESNLNNLKTIFGDSTMSYDTMAIDYSVDDSFDFNAVLIYYTVYNQTKDEILGTNLLGIMFLDAPSGNTSDITTSGQGILMPSLEKIMSGPAGFGTSYSLRLNIKTDNMVDDTTATIVDESTSNQLWGEEWQEAFKNLDIAVNTLTQQNDTINYISGQYIILQDNQTQIVNQLKSLQYQVNDIGKDIKGEAGTVPLFSDGDDPLIESSIYMKWGRVGIFNKDPQYGLHIDVSVKTKDIILENAIRDTSDNILLGYGSPLQLGASSNFREIDFYTGNITPVIQIDTSNHTQFNDDVSMSKDLQVDGSVWFKYLTANTFYSPNFDFSKQYLAVPEMVGSGLNWDGNFLSTVPSSDVSAAGNSGDIQFAGVGGSLDAESSLNWESSTGLLKVSGGGRYNFATHNSPTLLVEHNYSPQVNGAKTNYNIGISTSLIRDFNISAGAVDSGYRIAGSFYSYVNDPSFQGTLANAYGMRIGAGRSTGAVGGGTINTVSILELEAIDSGSSNVTIDDWYSIRSSGSNPRMYHSGDVRIGNDADNESKLSVYVDEADKYAGYFEQNDETGNGISINLNTTNDQYALRVSSTYHIDLFNVLGDGTVNINNSSSPEGTLHIGLKGNTVSDGVAMYNGTGSTCVMFHNAANEFAFNRGGVGQNALEITSNNKIKMPTLSGVSTSSIIFYNTTTGELTYGAAPSGVGFASGDVNEYMLTATGVNSIQGHSNIRFGNGTSGSRTNVLKLISDDVSGGPSSGSAELGIVNSNTSSNNADDHTYSGFVWLDSASSPNNIPQSSVAASMKHRLASGNYAYGHIAVGLDGTPRLWYKGNTSSIETSAASGGNWALLHDNRNHILPQTANLYNLGSTTYYYADLYFNPPAGTQNNILYYDSVTRRVYKGEQAVITYTNGSNNRILTADSSTGITAESNLEFDGSNLQFLSATNIIVEDNASTTLSGYNFSITGSNGGEDASIGRDGGDLSLITGNGNSPSTSDYSGNGGHLYLTTGDGGGSLNSGNGGNIYLRAGDGGDGFTAGNGGDIYIAGGDNGSGSTPGTDGNVYLGFYGDGISGTRGSIYANLANSAQAYKVVFDTSTKILSYELDSSDIKFKTNLTKIPDALNKIEQMNGYTFNFNENAEIIGIKDTSTRHIGVIAQEIEKIVPELVTTVQSPEEGESIKQVHYDKMSSLLLEGIKELKTIIDNQEKNIKELQYIVETQQREIELLKN